MTSKPKFPRPLAISVARELVRFLAPYCERLIVAGSLRRRKAEVGDIEILYIPKFTAEADGLFDTKCVNLVDRQLKDLLLLGTVEKRLNTRGSETWGERNKLARHTTTQLPIDFFQANSRNWYNYLVCRTGSAANNIRIASTAEKRGWKWHPYGAGFTNPQGELVPVTSERDAFELISLPYLEPWER